MPPSSNATKVTLVKIVTIKYTPKALNAKIQKRLDDGQPLVEVVAEATRNERGAAHGVELCHIAAASGEVVLP